MILETILWLACAAPDADDLELRAAGIAFTPPPSFEVRKSQAPFVFTFFRRQLATEVASGRVFIVPIDPAADLDAAAARARTVVESALDLAVGGADSESPPDATELVEDRTSPATGRRHLLAVRRVGERYVAMSLDLKDAKDEPTVEAARAAFDAVAPSSAPYPVAELPIVLSSALALRGILPHAFELETGPDRPANDGAAFRPAWHLGVDARIELSIEGSFTDLPIADAAARLRDAIIERDAANLLDRFESREPPLGFSGAFRLGFDSGSRAHEVALLETERLRFRIELDCEDVRRAALVPAFESIVRSIRYDALLAKPRFASRMALQQAGFSFTPLSGFERLPGDPDDFAFVENARRPPRTRLTIRLAESELPAPSDVEEALERARARAEDITASLAADGWSLAGDPITLLSSGTFGARYWFERKEGQLLVRDQRTLCFGDGRSFEISLAAAESEFVERREAFEGMIASFRVVPQKLEPTLGDAILSKDGRLAIRPPQHWRLRAAAGDSIPGALTLEPADATTRLEIVTGIDPTPPAAPLVGLAERYRDHIERDLAARGAAAVRVEDSTTHDDGELCIYRVAYSLDGTAMKELRIARFTNDGVAFAAARCPAPRFPWWRNVFLASLDTLHVDPAP